MSANADPGDVRTGASPPTDALRLVLQTALDAVVVRRNDGIVADWNGQAVKVFGWTHAEAVGRPMADLIIPERYREAHKSGLKRYLSSGEATVLGRRIEVSATRKNGDEFPIELSIAAIPGDRLLFVGFLRDMTERTLRQAQSEVAPSRHRAKTRKQLGNLPAPAISSPAASTGGRCKSDICVCFFMNALAPNCIWKSRACLGPISTSCV